MHVKREESRDCPFCPLHSSLIQTEENSVQLWHSYADKMMFMTVLITHRFGSVLSHKLAYIDQILVVSFFSPITWIKKKEWTDGSYGCEPARDASKWQKRSIYMGNCLKQFWNLLGKLTYWHSISLSLKCIKFNFSIFLKEQHKKQGTDLWKCWQIWNHLLSHMYLSLLFLAFCHT